MTTQVCAPPPGITSATDDPYIRCVFDAEAKWLAERRYCVGASESAALVIPNYKWKSPYALYVSKVADSVPAWRESMPQRLGKAFESAIIAEAAKTLGDLTAEKWTICKSKARPWMSCSRDAYGHDDLGPFGVDAKFVGADRAEEWENGQVPLAYNVQCQSSMAVTGWSRWFLAVAIGNRDFKVVEVPRHDAFIDRVLIPAIDHFWLENVVKRVAPPMDGSESTKAAVAAMYPDAEDGVEIVLPPEAITYASEMARLDEEAALLKDRANLNRYMIKALIGDASIGWLPDGSGGFSHKWEHKKEHVRAASSSRVLRAVKPKTGGGA